MKISYNWLNEFLPTQKTPQELDQLLTDTGLEVEGFETLEAVKGGLEGVIVAQVVTCEQHPNADRLKVTTINTGSEIVQVVCGAPNVAAGQKVLLATVGCTLYPTPDSPLKMKVSKIRDVESHGMLCAEDELGLGQSHDGILVLPDTATIGMPAAQFLELENDVQIEIGLTPNRADAMGHIGVARDVLAYMTCHENSSARLQLKPVKELNKTKDLPVKITVQDTERCPRYMGVTISGIEVSSSPAWLQKRLRSVGLSPINAVVDITNYVMRELGTPLHAFDAEKVGKEVIVRTAKENEKITTLDGEIRELNPEDLVIANNEGAMCIAGVFGGAHSGINDQTKHVFLEAAYFQPISVRKTAKRHGLSTDASFRFERGVDIDLIPYALKRAANLILEVCGGEIGMEISDAYPTPIQKREITFRLERCTQIIGAEIPIETIRTILLALDFEIIGENASSLQLIVPNYRIDVDREIDVIEEVLRIYGFNKIPFPTKLNASIQLASKPDIEQITTSVATTLAGLGFHECMNNSLTTPLYVEKFGKVQFSSIQNVAMLNPLSQELAVMRQSLVFQQLETVAHNQNRQNPDLKLMEFGKIYRKVDSKYEENKRLLLTISGRKQKESWNSSSDKSTLFQLKGLVKIVFERLGLDGLTQEIPLTNNDCLVDGFALSILKKEVGTIGWIKPNILKHFGIKNDVFVADLDWDALIDSLKLSKTQYKELPKTFAVRRDYSLLLNTAIRFSQIQEVASKADRKILKSVGLFDVYEGDKLPEGKKSYAVSFTFQDQENTLKDEQIDRIMGTIRENLEKELGAELR